MTSRNTRKRSHPATRKKSGPQRKKSETKDRYLRLMDFKSPEEAYAGVRKLASGLDDRAHTIRSCIFDLHAAVEIELRRVLFHTFKAQLFLTADEMANSETLKTFETAIDRLSFAEMYKILRPVLNSWPYPDLISIREINSARNAAAHGHTKYKVLYKNRSPFEDADCFAQMYFDVWAIKQSMEKFFDWVIERPQQQLRRYVEKYGVGEL